MYSSTVSLEKMSGYDNEGEVEEMTPVGPPVSVPDSLKGLRCCFSCLLIKSTEQFANEGCENCRFLPEGEYRRFTTPFYQGCVALMQPKQSWVARWQKVQNFIPGCYAVKVAADIPDEVDELCAEAGVMNLGKISQEDNEEK